MKHSIEELLDVVYRHYPRGIPSDDPRYAQSEEYQRLVAARRAAGAASEPWRAMLRRLGERFPECSAQNGSLHLTTGGIDAGYCGSLYRLNPPPGEHFHTVDFRASFLVPYYLVFGMRAVDESAEATGDGPIWFDTDIYYFGATFQGAPAVAGIKAEKWQRASKRRMHHSFAPAPEDQAYWDAISREIETTFGYEPMPVDIVRTVVPDVMTNLRLFGEATLCDCLMSDSWS